MRILNVNNTLDPVRGGGTAERTLQMSRFLARSHVDCSILATDIGFSDVQMRALHGIQVVAYPCLSARFYIPKFSYRQVRALVNNADVVHLMGHWTFLNALTYLIARSLRKAYVVCPAGALRIYGRSTLLKRVYNGVIGKRIVRGATACIAISKSEIADFEKYGVALTKVRLIPNGIDEQSIPDMDHGAFLENHGLRGKRIILFVGRLHSIKGPDLLLEAFIRIAKEFEQYHLVFIGPDDGMLNGLRALVREQELDGRVHFLGYIGGAEKYQAYYAADLLVIPSRMEAMSIVVLEAGAVGTPVLLTEQCGFDEISAIGAGRVVPCTADALASGLEEMLRDRRKLEKMGARLRQYVRENYSWSGIVDRYLQLYSEILGAGPAR